MSGPWVELYDGADELPERPVRDQPDPGVDELDDDVDGPDVEEPVDEDTATGE